MTVTDKEDIDHKGGTSRESMIVIHILKHILVSARGTQVCINYVMHFYYMLINEILWYIYPTLSIPNCACIYVTLTRLQSRP